MPIQCQVCKYINISGAVICENCGSELSGTSLAASSTRKLEKSELSQAITTASQNSAMPVTVGTLLRFEVTGSNVPILVAPRETIMIGRRDPQSGNLPDVDLTPFAGYRMGVSRNHAVLNIDGDNRLTVQDLGSSNGTFLNGIRLNPHSPYRVQNGDEIRLGQMAMRVFIGASYSASAPVSPDASESDASDYS